VGHLILIDKQRLFDSLNQHRRFTRNKMSYSITKESLVPLLTRCLIRHGSIEAIRLYPDSMAKKGMDATICDEFIVMNEISSYEDSEAMIREAHEEAIKTCKSAFEKANAETKELKAEIKELKEQQTNTESLSTQKPWWFFALGWAVVIGVAAWVHEPYIPSDLPTSIVFAGTLFICFFAYLDKRHRSREK